MSNDFISKIKKYFRHINSFLQFYSAIVTISGISLVSVIYSLVNKSDLYIKLILILISGLFTGIAINKYLYFRKKNTPSYVIESYETLFKVISDDLIEQTIRMKVKFNDDHIDTFPCKFNWQGDGNIEMQSLSLEHKINYLGSRDNFYFYEISLGREMLRGQTEIIAYKKIIHNPGDYDKNMSKNIIEPIEHLKIEVELPLPPQQAFKFYSELPLELNNMHTEKLDTNLKRRFLLDVNNPKKKYVYGIRWVDEAKNVRVQLKNLLTINDTKKNNSI